MGRSAVCFRELADDLYAGRTGGEEKRRIKDNALIQQQFHEEKEWSKQISFSFFFFKRQSSDLVCRCLLDISGDIKKESGNVI